MFEIIPSPGTENKTWEEIEKKLEQVKPFAKTIHVDVCDGIFTPNTTYADPKPFAKYAKDFIFEIHLMTENPAQYLKSWADAGFQRFIGQIEMMPDQAEFVAKAEDLGEVGLAIDKQTPVDAIQVPFEDLDTLLVMTIQAGFSGQKLEERLLNKVKDLANKTLIPIEVDGGISEETIVLAAKMGATRFVATSFLFGTDNPQKQFQVLEEKLKTVTLA